MDPLKMLDLQYKGLNAVEVAAQLGVSEKTVRRVAKRIGCPFRSRPETNYPCISCKQPGIVTYYQRTCGGCRETQRKRGLTYIEIYSVTGG